MIHPEIVLGSTIGGYHVERLLAGSQAGTAYLVIHPTHGRKATAITFPLPESLSFQERERLEQRLAQEAELLTHLMHPHILPVYACGMRPGFAYLVTACVEEASLGHYLKQSIRFSPHQTLSLLKQLAAGLEYAHRHGVVHGMVRLSQVSVSRQFHLRIAGFGVRTMLDLASNGPHAHPLTALTSKHGAFLSPPEAIAPQRLVGRPLDAGADIAALGVMLFELLTGIAPFTGPQGPLPSIHAVCPEVPEVFDLVLGKMVERDPTKRIQQVSEALASFERIVHMLDPGWWDQARSPGQTISTAQVTIPPVGNWW